MDTTKIANDLWTIVYPIVSLIVVTVGPVIVAYISGQIINRLGISNDAKKKEVEAQVRDALHASLTNGLKLGLTKAGALDSSGRVPLEALQTAVDYVKERNPDAVKASKQSDEQLQEMALAKAPDVLGVAAPSLRPG